MSTNKGEQFFPPEAGFTLQSTPSLTIMCSARVSDLRVELCHMSPLPCSSKEDSPTHRPVAVMADVQQLLFLHIFLSADRYKYEAPGTISHPDHSLQAKIHTVCIP